MDAFLGSTPTKVVWVQRHKSHNIYMYYVSTMIKKISIAATDWEKNRNSAKKTSNQYLLK